MDQSFLTNPISTTAAQARRPVAKRDSSKSTLEACRKIASARWEEFGGSLPETKSFELYLIRGLRRLTINGQEKIFVSFEPEFVFILDVGAESLVGVSVYWTPVGIGDPSFPNFDKSDLRSVRSRNESSIIYPDVAASLLIGVKEGTPDDEIRAKLSDEGLKDIEISGTFVEARCKPFQERSVGKRVETNVSFVKYAGPNQINRLIDFEPGWSCERLM